MRNNKQYKLSHAPLPKDNKPMSAQEELEIAKDLILQDVTLYTAQELADFIERGIITYQEVEDVCSPSQS